MFYQIKDTVISQTTNNNEAQDLLIIDQTDNDYRGQDFLLKTDSKLGDIFDFLPHGRINKKETGIGATTLELKSKRNSIIVFPTRHTAFSKSGGDVHYFNSDESTKKATQNKVKHLNSYLENHNIQYKKITVVADSLPKLLGIIGATVFTDYFLLLDEIDSIQKDSIFRKRMEICMEFYKRFNLENRAVVSATLLDFSDPSLKDEILTNFKYKTAPKGKIHIRESLHETNYGNAFEIIQGLLNLGNGKIVVAFNEVESILILADYMVEKKLIEYSEIAVLCGNSPKNKERIAKFNSAVIANSKYPCKLNFLTSANFTGYDIDEPYHLVIISNATYEHTRLSEFEMVQISGRCRMPNKLLSFNIIYSLLQKSLDKPPKDIKDLIKFSQTEIKALNCISHHYHTDELGIEKAEHIRTLLVNNSGYGNYNFVCKNNANEYVTSYLNIDAYLEDQRLKYKIYSNKKYLVNYFKSLSYLVDFSEHYSTESVGQEKSQSEKVIEQHKTTFEFLFNKKIITQAEIDAHIKDASTLSVKMCEFYTRASSKLTAINIKKFLNEADTVKKVKDLLLAYTNCTADKKEFNKRNIHVVFPIGLTITPLEKERKTEEILTNLSLVEPSRYNKSKGAKLINSYIEFIKTSININGTKIKAYKVKSHNPYKFRFKRNK
jgi:hypothetical protein